MNIIQYDLPRWRLLLVGRDTEKYTRRGPQFCSPYWLIQGLGERSDVPDILKLADLFILPSRGEGSSNALLEAMAAGIPVIATRVGGNVDMVIDTRTGILVPAKRPDVLAAAIVHCQMFPTERKERARLAQLDVVVRFSFDEMINQYENLYREVGHGVAM